MPKSDPNPKVRVTFRLPREIAEAIDMQVQTQGGAADRTSVVVEVLRVALGLEGDRPTPIVQRVEALEKMLARVIDRLAPAELTPSKPKSGHQPAMAPKRRGRLRDEGPDADGWYTPFGAFRLRGGDPHDGSSQISTLDGDRWLAVNTFRLPVRVPDYRAFGFKADPVRRSKKKPWLRPLPDLLVERDDT